ncbi:MAG: tRNA pseudouridine(38-40) synthase TruA [Chlamydiae bacterium]|nr:tRNA pseudouridine(38-40) synthase TruA [Chlamydiota bacterium]
MKNIKMILSYDGTKYLGWQKTPCGPTIEEALENALFQIFQTPIRLQAASRTDAGVHAYGQVVNFFIDDEVEEGKLLHSMNGLLAKDISIRAIEQSREDFHPTLDSKGKEYCYYICNSTYQLPFHKNFSWHFPYDMCFSTLQKATHTLTGYKDFSTFCNDRNQFSRSTFCKISSITIEQLPLERICIRIQGTRFLYKMVRNMVGTLAYIASGKIPLPALESILSSRQRASAGITAPAQGLFLNQVFY